MLFRAPRRWWRSLVGLGRRGPGRRTVPRLEALEERAVPATIVLDPFLPTRFQDGPVTPLTTVIPGQLFTAPNLRSAVPGANAMPGDDYIFLESGFFSLRGDLFGGDLSINDPSGGSLTIRNLSGPFSVIDGGQHSRI